MLASLATILFSIPAAHATGFGFDAEYIDCDEFAGVGLADLEAVQALVPDDYTVVSPFEGAAIIVAQAGSCDTIKVAGRGRRAGSFAQFGVSVVPPTGASSQGTFYQLVFVTDHPRLFARMRVAGVPAVFSRRLDYTITPTSDTDADLRIEVPRPRDFAWTLQGPITLPDPSGPPNPLTTFDYWVQSPRTGNVLQRNEVTGIRLGDGSGVTLTAHGVDLQEIVGIDPITFPFFSAPEIFDVTDLTVTTNAF